MSDRRTKQQLLDRIEELTKSLDRAIESRGAVKPEPPAVEGVAVSECIRALSQLKVTSSATSVYSKVGESDSAAVSRVLRHLAEFHGVPLVEVRTEPCSRAHIDQLDSYALTNAIQSAVRS